MLDIKTVKHIADLAKLELSSQELESYATQLSSILGHFEQLASLDTSSVDAIVSSSPIVHPMREDICLNKDGAENSLSNAKSKSGNLFKVPPVV